MWSIIVLTVLMALIVIFTALDQFSSLIIGPLYARIILGFAGINSLLMVVQLAFSLGTETIMKYWIITFLCVEGVFVLFGVVYSLIMLWKKKGDINGTVRDC